MSGCEFVQSRLVPIAFPADREEMFLLPLQKGCIHCRAHEAVANPAFACHLRTSHNPETPFVAASKREAVRS